MSDREDSRQDYYAFVVSGIFVTWYRCRSLAEVRYVCAELIKAKAGTCGYNDVKMTRRNLQEFCLDNGLLMGPVCVPEK